MPVLGCPESRVGRSPEYDVLYYLFTHLRPYSVVVITVDSERMRLPNSINSGSIPDKAFFKSEICQEVYKRQERRPQSAVHVAWCFTIVAGGIAQTPTLAEQWLVTFYQPPCENGGGW